MGSTNRSTTHLSLVVTLAISLSGCVPALKLREARMSSSFQRGAGDTGVRMWAASAAISVALSFSEKAGICVAGRPLVITFSASAGRRRDRPSGSRAGPIRPVRCSPWQAAQCCWYRA